MLVITKDQADDIDTINRTRTDGGVGVVFDGSYYRCTDVRDDPNYAEYHSILSGSQSYCEPIPRWKGRAYLASQPAVSEGPLAAHSGTTLLDQVDAYMVANLTKVQTERYLGTATWDRGDVMITGMAALLGLTDAEVDAWFAAAKGFE